MLFTGDADTVNIDISGATGGISGVGVGDFKNGIDGGFNKNGLDLNSNNGLDNGFAGIGQGSVGRFLDFFSFESFTAWLLVEKICKINQLTKNLAL